MDETRPIPPFRCESMEKQRLSREWESWKGSLECYFDAYAITDQRMMKAKLLHLGGVELQRVFRSLPDHDKFPVVALDPKFYDLAIDVLDGYFLPGKQDVIERRKLRQLKQEAGEKFSHYLIRLRQQAANCGFEKYHADVGDVLKEIYLIDIIVENCRSEELRRSILKKDRKLVEIEEIAACVEGTEQQLKDLKESTSSVRERSIFEVQGPRQPFRDRNRATESRYAATNFRSNASQLNWNNTNVSCFACGESGHVSKSRNCPAKGRTCRRCKGLGHYEALCRKRKPEAAVTSKSKKAFSIVNKEENLASGLERSEPTADEEQKVYYAFYGGNETNILPGVVGGIPIDLLVDSGADVNLIKLETWEAMKEKKVHVIKSVKGCTKILKGYGSDKPLAVVGSFVAEITIGSKTVTTDFFVVKGGQKNLLGDSTAKRLGVLKIGLDINQIDSAVKPFNKITDVQAHIRTNPQFKPVFQPLRRVPIPMEDAVSKKLDQLLVRDIIEVKKGPATWVSPLVIVGKASGEPRICLDLRRLNEAVVRKRFPMPLVEEYLARIGKGKVWSKLDIREAFHQVELAEDSRDVTTFITSRGLFRFKRLPFGLVTAPEIFQRVMEEMLSGCEGCYWYLDDVIIEGETQEAHDANLEKVA